MPSYNPKVIEPRWQHYWQEHQTFRTPDQSDKPKCYVLDMFPYPSGAGLHVGHPEGYTATDILCRYRRMRGLNVLHPMGWDAFGLPAEQHAIKTGEHPRINTQNNVNNFRRQIQMLGFSYDWDREVDTTDPSYFKWTQWIFLQMFDTWYDAAQQRGRPIAELPIPDDVRAEGDEAVRAYQDGKRLAYQAEVPVNWCPALGTVLANEEVVDGKSERGGHAVERKPLRQWLLRITAYAERLLDDLALVDWPTAIKKQQQDWIGRSEGAEVDFRIAASGGRQPPANATIRVFTTRPDTLFGATYMVLSPEHPLVDAITQPGRRAEVERYRAEAARKSDQERTALAKKKTGVNTGAMAINPANNQSIPIWIADYVLSGYGTGAIMAVPAHDERDFEFAKEYNLPIRAVVIPPVEWLRCTRVYKNLQDMERKNAPRTAADDSVIAHEPPPTLSPSCGAIIRRGAIQMLEQHGGDVDQAVAELYRTHANVFDEVYTCDGIAFNSGPFDGLPTPEFQRKITAWLAERGVGASRVNYKLRDWLFSRQRYWGEPFPILHELDETGEPTGCVRPLDVSELPLTLPALEDYKPSGRPEPPLGKAGDWLYVTRDGKRYKRETNTMPQWAGSCWYYLRYLDPKNDQHFCDSAKAKHWLPVDLYVGGAEHAVLHLLYSRFWHKVLYDRGYVPTPEPFHKLINQGMILGEVQYSIIPAAHQANQRMLTEKGLVALRVELEDKKEVYVIGNRPDVDGAFKNLTDEQVEKRKGTTYLAGTELELTGRAEKMSKSRGNVINPDDVVRDYGADSLRLYEMFMGPLEATKPWNMRGVEGVSRFLSRVWRLTIDDRAEDMKLADTVHEIEPDRDTLRQLRRTVQKVTDDLEAQPIPRFNTAIAAMMEFTNHLTGLAVRPKSVLTTFMLLLSPFAPHLAEELWRALGHDQTLAYEPWPSFDPALTKADEIEVPVQINGKVRARLLVPPDIDKAALEKTALADESVQKQLEGKQVKKVIVVPGKLVNIVVG